jgi:hypothetical protein
MIYVIVVIVLIVLVVGAVLARRRGGDRGVTYAPDLQSPVLGFGAGGTPSGGPGVLPQVAIPSSEVTTEGIARDEFVGDATDDLLDPRNPGHAQWVKEHPAMETDAEWLADHPEDRPS